MSTSHLRIVVVGLSLIVAVFAGLVSGWAGGSGGCTEQGPTGNTPFPTDTPTADPTGGGNNPKKTFGPVPGDSARPGGGGSVDVVTCSAGFSPGSALVGFGGALLAGLAAGGVALLVPRRDRAVASGWTPPHTGGVGTATGTHPVLTDTGSQPVTGTTGTRPSVPDSSSRAGHVDRAALVETCIYVRDRATSRAIADHLARTLDRVGVTEVRPAGVAFDASQHEAGGSAPTDDPRLDGTIAAVEIPGYTDRGAVLRLPVVTVYRLGSR